MKKILISAAGILCSAIIFSSVANAASTTHTVIKGDTMWKIAVKYEVGLSEIKGANAHIPNPDLS